MNVCSVKPDQDVNLSHVNVVRVFQRMLDLRLVDLGGHRKNQHAGVHLLCVLLLVYSLALALPLESQSVILQAFRITVCYTSRRQVTSGLSAGGGCLSICLLGLKSPSFYFDIMIRCVILCL